LNAILHLFILRSGILLKAIRTNAIMLRVILVSEFYPKVSDSAECHCAECHFAVILQSGILSSGILHNVVAPLVPDHIFLITEIMKDTPS
jgi:hypothetical protein